MFKFCSKDDWQKFKSGEYYTDYDLEANFFTEEEVREKIVNNRGYRYYEDDSRMDIIKKWGIYNV